VTGDTDLSAATVVEFRQAIRAGRLKPGMPETKHILGKMFLASFLASVDTPWFDARFRQARICRFRRPPPAASFTHQKKMHGRIFA
jgi:hypothetical protein